jgi:hypothetical protein
MSALSSRPEARMLTLRKADYLLLAAALLLGIAATLRRFGVGHVSPPAAGFLAGAIILSLVPLARLFAGSAAAPLDEESFRGRRRAIIAAVFCFNLVAVLFFFPPEDILDNRPVLSLDHSLHFYQVERAKEAFGKSLRLDSYDPYFMAGYPGGAVFDIDSKGVELWCALLRVDTARAYKIFIALVYLLLPLTIYAACRRLGCRFDESVFALLFVLPFWHWGRPYVDHFRYAGMFSFLCVCYLSLYLAGLFRSFLNGEPVKRFYVIGPLAFFVHPTTALLVPVPFIALLFARRGAGAQAKPVRAASRAARFVLWCAIVLVVNALWLVPLLRYLGTKTPSETFFQLKGLPGLFGVLVQPGNVPALLLCTLAIIGAVRLARDRRWETLSPAAGSIFFLLIAAFGVYVPLFNQLEPGRFLVPALLFAAPLAGAGAATIVAAIRASRRAPRLSAATPVVLSIVLLASAPVLALGSARAFYRHTLSTTFTRAAQDLIEELTGRIDPSGRLMIEDGPAWAYGNTFLPALLPLHTGVEQIGGPYPFTFLAQHRVASFETCKAFGRALADTDASRFREYLDLYNIHWIVTATPDCAARVESLVGAPAWSSGSFRLWNLSSTSTFASARGVSVKASLGVINVTVSPEPGEALAQGILLKYHWDPGLRASSPARISPQKRLDDPVPFILLEPGAAREIVISYH